MEKINKLKNCLIHPLSTLRILMQRFLKIDFSPKTINDDISLINTGKKIDWINPRDINEKINWLQFNSNTSDWIILADKYLVRDFIKDRIGEKYLVPLLGVWEDPEDIDYSKLPQSFVLKTNNGAGSVIIIKDKEQINKEKIRSTLFNWLNEEFGKKYVQPHYSKIKPLIIAEYLLTENSLVSSSLIDYKIWCFNGKVFGTWCCFNREGFVADTEWHDIDWNFHPEWSVFTDHYRNGQGKIPKPTNYKEMLEIASKLSQGFPQVRVDLYNVNGHIFFGEMTFSSAGGHMNFYSDPILKILGELTDLSICNKGSQINSKYKQE